MLGRLGGLGRISDTTVRNDGPWMGRRMKRKGWREGRQGGRGGGRGGRGMQRWTDGENQWSCSGGCLAAAAYSNAIKGTFGRSEKQKSKHSYEKKNQNAGVVHFSCAAQEALFGRRWCLWSSRRERIVEKKENQSQLESRSDRPKVQRSTHPRAVDCDRWHRKKVSVALRCTALHSVALHSVA